MLTRIFAFLFILQGFVLPNPARAQDNATIPSPEAFLGYPLGSRYTPHWKIVAYFQQVAAKAADRMTLTEYGKTYEGRPLLLAAVSSPGNIRNLESIRRNNLRLAGLAADKMAPQDYNAPAIVWLSYNVHGNEASSSEAAMQVLYELVHPNGNTGAWLQQAVVLIDPCINPDGRDRYVNWFNSVSGRNYNPLPVAREHREPWPGGRTNHYNFDLNRDWAWQTQTESRQRIRAYNEWMPQVHVDFHEQGINEPYYFPPAAEPFHEVITPWQREFQEIIGRNHARYFDANGWLYFTKLRFDLFYPSYGDTWPTYNGAIGMTYEQGGIGAGLGVFTDEGDTLTLTTRIRHHVTTSLSTVEVSSIQAARLVKEFRNYFSEAQQQGAGMYKAFLVRYEEADADRISKLTDLLERNGIRFGRGNGGTVKGYGYLSRKEETVTAGANDLLIPGAQPKAALLKVLFEPQSKLADSVTYDITAWTVPYAYGLNAYALKERAEPAGSWAPPAFVPNATANYGYALPWTGLRAARFAGLLLQKGVLLRYAEQDFELGGRRFGKGTILVLSTANQRFGSGLMTLVKALADSAQVRLHSLPGGMVDRGYDLGSEQVHPFRAPRVVLLTGESVNSNAAGAIWHFFDEQLEYPVTLVNGADIGRLNWNETDVLVMPDGGYRFLNNKDEADKFREWLNKGGRVIALEGAVSELSKAELLPKAKRSEDSDRPSRADQPRSYENKERDAVAGMTPGSIWKLSLDPSHPLAYGYPDFYYTLKQDDRLYEFMSEGGWNVGVIKEEGPVAGFVGSTLLPRMKNGVIVGVKQQGNGSITFFADDLLFRSFWENGKLMFCNAVFFSSLN